jgi:hypothetical protein
MGAKDREMWGKVIRQGMKAEKEKIPASDGSNVDGRS